jgi:hypothetical protein
LWHRPLEIDEAMLGLNLIGRGSYGGLLHPLDFEQTAPVLFLWLSRASAALFGVDERSLRALPFIAGIVLVPLVWYAARRLLASLEGAALAAACAAVCPIAISYAAFLKPYAVDAAVAAALLVLALKTIAAPTSRSSWWLLGIACSLAPLLSTPSVLVTAAVIAGLAVSPSIRSDGGGRRLAILSTAWVACAAANFFALQRSTVQDSYMQRYWDGAFFRPPMGHLIDLARSRIGWTVQELFLGDSVPYPAVVRVLLVLLVLWGLIAITQRHGLWATLLLAGPAVAAVIVSAFCLYPLSERTLLFAAPAVVIAMAAGLEGLAAAASRGFPRIRAVVFAAVATLVLIPATVDGVLRVRDLGRPDDVRASIADLLTRARPDAPIYVFSRDLPVWTFYTTNWRSPDTTRVRLLMHVAMMTGPNSGNMPGRGHPVEHEGDDFVVRSDLRTELIGIPTGMQARFADVTQQSPDPGWATNEARRIRAAANPDAWLFFTHCHNTCDSTLVDTLLGSGTRIAYERTTPSARIYEFVRQLP